MRERLAVVAAIFVDCRLLLRPFWQVCLVESGERPTEMPKMKKDSIKSKRKGISSLMYSIFSSNIRYES